MQRRCARCFRLKTATFSIAAKSPRALKPWEKPTDKLATSTSLRFPDTRFDEDKKLIYIDIDLDEGKQFYVRRIEFQGNTTTRDKVIRREILLEEGQVYNQQLWELSLQRLNQLGFFDNLKPDDPSTTERHLDEKNGTVDLLLKVKEKGKNSIVVERRRQRTGRNVYRPGLQHQ